MDKQLKTGYRFYGNLGTKIRMNKKYANGKMHRR